MVTGLEKVTSPASQSSCTLTLVRSPSKWSGVLGLVIAEYLPSEYEIIQKPPSGHPEMCPFLSMDSLTTPTIQSTLLPTSTSQAWQPEVKPSDPSTNTKRPKRSGLSGSCCRDPVLATLVKSAERDSQG
ncbi:hypothetical protein XENOCAPTIV_022930 [Xenoophorus captivus]|uniref:Uncharacterized protein n=1 Tax=Xenoophorus captivus TaxID=1517983 RepID=A0ABV0QB45_9TELE